MVKGIVLLFLSFVLSFGDELEEIKEFFSRKGYVVDRLSDGRVITDLGQGKAFSGEEFYVIREGKEIVHPVTGEVLGHVEEKMGRIRIIQVEEKFSVAEVIEDLGINRGLRVKLVVDNVCFSGSDEGFFKVSSVIPKLKRSTEGCKYVIRELERGYGVELEGKAIAFFEKEIKEPQIREIVVEREKEKKPKKISLKLDFILSFPQLPLSADVCDLFGDGKKYLVVLFPEILKVYEIVNEELVDFTSMRLPAGYPLFIQCANLEGREDLILLNMLSSNQASSAIVKLVGDSLAVIAENVPYIMVVLDKEKPKETFVGQIFDEEWKEVKALSFVGNSVVEKGDFKVPKDFKVDSAMMFKDIVLFVDKDGYLRVYKNGEEILSQKEFSGSYTVAELEEGYEDTEKIVINPRPFVVNIDDNAYIGVIRNVTNPVFRFLNVIKFSEGEIYLIDVTDDQAELKKVKTKRLEETIQSVVNIDEETIFILTGRSGTIAQQKGDLYKGKFKW